MKPQSTHVIDMGRVIELLEAAVARAGELDGKVANDAGQGRQSSAANAEVSKSLLALETVIDAARVEVKLEMQLFKGERIF